MTALRRTWLALTLAASLWIGGALPARADPITASIVAFVGFTGTAAAVATFVINTALYTAASWAAGKLLGKSKASVQERQASVTTLSLGEGPRELIVGEAATGGSLIDAFNHGGEYGTDYVTRCVALADHALDGLVGYFVDDQFYAFAANGIQPGFSGALDMEFVNATAAGAAPPARFLAASGGTWDVTDVLAGVAHIWVSYKTDDKVWVQGHPQFRFVTRGLRVYDPRKDAALGYAGPDPQTWEDRATHTYSRNAALLRYAFVRGIYAEGRQGQLEHLLIGRGLTATEAPPERIIAAANVCDEVVAGAARYEANGVIRSSDDFIVVEEMFAAAQAGVIVQREGGIEIEPGQAKSAVVTITDGDLVVGERVTFSEFLPDGDGGRINTVIPRYVDPAQNWKDHAGPVRRDLADITADGGPRELTLPLLLVTAGPQADRCAEVTRRLGRLERRATIVLPPDYAELEEGDWIAWTSVRRHGGATVTYRIESWSLDEQWRQHLSLREISAVVYADATALVDGGDTPPAPGVPAAVALSGVAATAITLPGTGASVPAIRVTWTTPVDPAILGIRAEVRAFGATDVAPTGIGDPAAGVSVLTGVSADQAVEVRLVPVANEARPVTASAWIGLTTPSLVVPITPAIADGYNLLRRTGGGDFTGALAATEGARAGTNLFRADGFTVLSQAEVNTAEGTSAFLQFQGDLATQSAALWGTQVTSRPALTQGNSLTEDPACADPSAWVVSPAGSSTFVTITDGAVARTALRGTSGTTRSVRPVSCDPAKTYLLEMWLRRTGTNNTAYGLVDLVDGNGASIAGDGGFWLYNPIGALIPATWTYYSKVFGAGTARPIPVTAREMRAGVLPNYGGVNPGAVECQGIRIVEVVRIGGSLYRLDGTLATEPQLVTSLGTSAFVEFQGPGATATAPEVLNNRLSGSVLTIPRPEGAVFSSGASLATGAIRIVLPQGHTNTMLSFRVRVFNYAADTWTEYQIAGNSYVSPNWTTPSARMIGPRSRARAVRFGYDTTLAKCVIWIGEPTDTWAYPKVEVLDFQAGHTNFTEAQWATGWTVGLDTVAATNVTRTVTTPRAGDAVFGEGVLESSGGAVATRAAFRTDQGTAAFLQYQGPLATSPLAEGQVRGRHFGQFAGDTAANAGGLQDGDTYSDTTWFPPNMKGRVIGGAIQEIGQRGRKLTKTTNTQSLAVGVTAIFARTTIPNVEPDSSVKISFGFITNYPMTRSGTGSVQSPAGTYEIREKTTGQADSVAMIRKSGTWSTAPDDIGVTTLSSITIDGVDYASSSPLPATSDFSPERPTGDAPSKEWFVSLTNTATGATGGLINFGIQLDVRIERNPII